MVATPSSVFTSMVAISVATDGDSTGMLESQTIYLDV